MVTEKQVAKKATKAPKTEADKVKGEPRMAASDLNKVLKVRKDLKFRGARQAWYERLTKFDGKPLGDYVKDVTQDRPSKYGARSTHAGDPEPVSGWVRFFVRNNYASLS
jgi:hypothetical protein